MAVSNKEYQKALAIVRQYQDEVSKKMTPTLTCICCKRNKVTAWKENTIDITSQDPLELVMWNGGTVALIHFGYGSTHDEESYYIALCDECLDSPNTKGILTIDAKEFQQKAHTSISAKYKLAAGKK